MICRARQSPIVSGSLRRYALDRNSSATQLLALSQGDWHAKSVRCSTRLANVRNLSTGSPIRLGASDVHTPAGIGVDLDGCGGSSSAGPTVYEPVPLAVVCDTIDVSNYLAIGWIVALRYFGSSTVGGVVVTMLHPCKLPVTEGPRLQHQSLCSVVAVAYFDAIGAKDARQIASWIVADSRRGPVISNASTRRGNSSSRIVRDFGYIAIDANDSARLSKTVVVAVAHGVTECVFDREKVA